VVVQVEQELIQFVTRQVLLTHKEALQLFQQFHRQVVVQVVEQEHLLVQEDLEDQAVVEFTQ
tara:strand:- start:335 stop:520 length:186 start_codon:yes stop_codon:yes gene_type:complete